MCDKLYNYLPQCITTALRQCNAKAELNAQDMFQQNNNHIKVTLNYSMCKGTKTISRAARQLSKHTDVTRT